MSCDLRSAVSTVSIAEVHTKLAEWGGNGEHIADELLFAVQDIVPFTAEQAVLCGKLRMITRPAGLSLGDRAAIALATVYDSEVVTSDRAWATLSLPCRVRLFR